MAVETNINQKKNHESQIEKQITRKFPEDYQNNLLSKYDIFKCYWKTANIQNNIKMRGEYTTTPHNSKSGKYFHLFI